MPGTAQPVYGLTEFAGLAGSKEQPKEEPSKAEPKKEAPKQDAKPQQQKAPPSEPKSGAKPQTPVPKPDPKLEKAQPGKVALRQALPHSSRLVPAFVGWWQLLCYHVRPQWQ